MMDRLIVRISAICINLWMLCSYIYAWIGESIAFWDTIFGSSLIGGVVITVLSFSQGKYHCKWMQAICVNILFTQILNLFSSSFVGEDGIISFLTIVSASWAVSTILAFYFAISHFIKVKRLKRQRNG